MLRYTYSFLCVGQISADLDRKTPINFRSGSPAPLLAWRDAFRLHAEACRFKKCPGPLLGAGVRIEDAAGRVLGDLYRPFADWESGSGILRPANLNPEVLWQAVDRLAAQVAPRPEVRARAAQVESLRLQLAQWGIRLRCMRTLREVARIFPARGRMGGRSSWVQLPGSRPTRWNSALLAPHLPPGILRDNPVRTATADLCQMPEPAGSIARASNLAALAALAVRDVLFGHPNIPSPLQLSVRLMSAALIPACVLEERGSLTVAVFEPPG